MATRVAVVSYELGADVGDRLRALERGLATIACELVELGMPLPDVERKLDDAYSEAELAAGLLERST